MSRSPYYTRRRARVQSPEPKPITASNGQAFAVGIGLCTVCNANLPFVLSDGLLYLQAPLGCIREEAPAEGCPWVVYLADGATKER